MPRPGPRRTALAVKVSADELADIDRFAAILGVTRSVWVRNALRYSIASNAYHLAEITVAGNSRSIARAAHQPTITGD